MTISVPTEIFIFLGVWFCGVIFGAVAALVLYLGSFDPWPA